MDGFFYLFHKALFKFIVSLNVIFRLLRWHDYFPQISSVRLETLDVMAHAMGFLLSCVSLCVISLSCYLRCHFHHWLRYGWISTIYIQKIYLRLVLKVDKCLKHPGTFAPVAVVHRLQVFMMLEYSDERHKRLCYLTTYTVYFYFFFLFIGLHVAVFKLYS